MQIKKTAVTLCASVCVFQASNIHVQGLSVVLHTVQPQIIIKVLSPHYKAVFSITQPCHGLAMCLS